MAAQGQSFFNATGDSDAFTGAMPFPSDSPDITQAGATTLTTTGPGGSYVSETVWNWGGGIGSSGGVSTYYRIPTWQQGVSMLTNQGSTTMRNIPDVALVGDNVYVTYNGGSSGIFGGTSCAAPLWAAYIALVNQQAVTGGRPTVGFINPAIYPIGKGNSYHSNFHDTTTGNNFTSTSPKKYSAVTGYDLCTGWGAPLGTALIDALTADLSPTVVTGTANGIVYDSGTLNATVTANGFATTAYFQYGPTTAYGGATGAQVMGSGETATSLAIGITGLKAATLYHYRCVATNSIGTVYGVAKSFTTADPPPVATTGSVTKATANGATLGGSVKPGGLAATAWFEYGLDTTYGNTTVTRKPAAHTGNLAVTVPSVGLTASTTYHYRIVASNTSGTSPGADKTFTTKGPAVVTTDATTESTANQTAVDGPGAAGRPSDEGFTTVASVPPTVSSVTVSAIGENVVTLGASVNPHHSATSVHILYGPTSAYWRTTGTVALEASDSASAFSVSLSALAPHTTYHARCVAQNGQGISVSKDVPFKTLPRFDTNGDGFSELLLLDDSTGETTLCSIGNTAAISGPLMVTGSVAGPVIPAGLTFRGEAEFNRDGSVGWVLSGSTASQTEFWTSGPDGNWVSTALSTGSFSLPNGSSVVSVADIDGDGKPDLVLVTPGSKVWFCLLDRFTVTAQKAGPSLPAGYEVVGIDSLNNNGKLDLLIWQPTTGATEILALNGASVSSTTAGPAIPTSKGWQLAGVNVFTGTGAPNWLLYNPTNQTTQLWMMQGGRKLLEIEGPSIPPGLRLLGTK
jgi:hypothetical protein